MVIADSNFDCLSSAGTVVRFQHMEVGKMQYGTGLGLLTVSTALLCCIYPFLNLPDIYVAVVKLLSPMTERQLAHADDILQLK